MGDRLQIARVTLQRGSIYLLFQIIGKIATDFLLDNPPRVFLGDTEEAHQHLLGGDRITMPGQHLRMCAAGDDFAVHEHAVAIEDDEIYRHEA